MTQKALKRSPQAQLLRAAGRQFGVVGMDEVRAVGLSRHQLLGMARDGLLRRHRRGIYVSTAVPTSHHQEAMLAVRAAPPGAVASHETALHLHGLGPAPSEVHVTVGVQQRVRLDGIVAHRSPMPPAHRALMGRMPVTSLARTLVDVASRTDLDEFARMLDPVLTDGRVHPARLLGVIDDIVDAPGRHGTTLLRTALRPWLAPIVPGSAAEARLLRLLDERGFGGWEAQLPVEVEGCCYRIDVGWRERRVGLEYSGRLAHAPRRWARDEARADDLRRQGWTIREVDAMDVRPADVALWAWLGEQLRGRAA